MSGEILVAISSIWSRMLLNGCNVLTVLFKLFGDGGGGRGNGAVALVATCGGGVGLEECDGDADADLLSLFLRVKMFVNAEALRVEGRNGVSSIANGKGISAEFHRPPIVKSNACCWLT